MAKARQRIITLLTDFGLADPYVAQMKGVVLGILPQATLVDITHDIPPGDILAGAFVLRQVLPHFPEGTVHCAVVDPGVGTQRKILAARYADQTIVFPDNGVITLVNADLPLEQIVSVRNEQFFLGPRISATFHGRDILAPVAAHVCGGLPLDRLGPRPEKFKLLDIPQPRLEDAGPVRPGAAPHHVLAGQIIYVDHFGNLISNIQAELLRETLRHPENVQVSCAGRQIGPLQAAYGLVKPGELLAIINSMSLVEIAANGGRACDILSAGVGAQVRVRPEADAKSSQEGM